MKFWKVDDLKHENEHIYYSKQYSGYLYLGNEVKYKTYPIKFILESDAFGRSVRNIEIDGKPNYPSIDLRKKIEEYIIRNF